jgi:hypothetical protein
MGHTKELGSLNSKSAWIKKVNEVSTQELFQVKFYGFLYIREAGKTSKNFLYHSRFRIIQSFIAV